MRSGPLGTRPLRYRVRAPTRLAVVLFDRIFFGVVQPQQATPMDRGSGWLSDWNQFATAPLRTRAYRVHRPGTTAGPWPAAGSRPSKGRRNFESNLRRVGGLM